ncbi:hypothetical protein [Candidatus Nitrosocosmicus arcticus]|uniref:Uncharacterized protein n=1 Tax=Candidatus Nitrosocosmicus arcticus TaxID=2035267 RepID=A0A557SZ49_9ARCH|nr:hypothetical protein [Candidatus Nitrosocosmicus arcticus]TVP41866.1 hypothetical protein NARC_10272 [Candidatus Nitrosocosmicus arcticus]
MKISELDYAEQFHVFNFLKTLAELVNGDVRKKVQLRKVWTGIVGEGINFPITETAFKDNIIPILVQDKLVGWDERDELNITYEGIYQVSEHYQISPETFGILSRNDLEKYSQSFLNLLFELTTNADLVTINSLKKRYSHRLGVIPIIQIMDSLEQQGLIIKQEINGDYALSIPEKSSRSPSYR